MQNDTPEPFSAAESAQFESRPDDEMKTVCPACGNALVLICHPAVLVRLQGEKIAELQIEIAELQSEIENLKRMEAHRWESAVKTFGTGVLPAHLRQSPIPDSTSPE